MKTAAFALALLGLFPSALAETLAPSPTESYGCEPHGDHYHCEGARATLSTVVTSEAAAATTAHEDEDDHDHAEGSGTLAASPTESYGCEPHGDHYHCEGARATLSTVVTSASVTAAATTEAHDHDEDETDTAAAGPSPTESFGCEPHGDHWHCDGARTATETETAIETPGSASTPTTSGDAATATGAAGMEMVPILGMVVAAVLAL
ncbi:hypothetical protein QQX98_003935 [Neonectria punicea]|uniref:Uncharacterized protein n=1 Tax=Neonectria punicea TaxID=979145 RepID=A0ABR1HC60_9HYPO